MVAFKAKDDSGSGFISVKDFYEIMVSIKSHLLTEPVKMNLIAAGQASGGSQTISYPYFMAFISLLSNIELIKKIYLNATSGSRTSEVTKGTFFLIILTLNYNLKTKWLAYFQRSSFTQLK
jgi:solute carrier family 25 aspartate/glutamate transporter 12/13